MPMRLSATPYRQLLLASAVLLFALLAWPRIAHGKQNIRDAFFAVYPDAVGTVIETVPSQVNHCGVCHYDFTGGGQRNPYGVALGVALEGFSNNPNGRRQAVESIAGDDPDSDGFSTQTEATDVATYSNTPTFPGLTPANIGNVSNVSTGEIDGHLVPTSGGDTTPPDVSVVAPNGGEGLTGNGSVLAQWTATDDSGIAAIDILLSIDGGATFTPLVVGIPGGSSQIVFMPNRPTAQALLRVVATDFFLNVGQDDSDAVFTIAAPAGGIAPTTLRDFDQPGTQPFEGGQIGSPDSCAACHGNYDAAVEPYANWRGTMMAQASRDPLFLACMAIANQDAPDSGDLCLRCHLPDGWLQGRSVPTDGSAMLASDMDGVSCDLCHRFVDPVADAANPAEDTAILAGLDTVPADFANGMFVADPSGTRRGPFADAEPAHEFLVSPFHREAALCGTCHDVSNPAFAHDGAGKFPPNAFDAPASDFGSDHLMAIERTYSEWFFSDFNTPAGIFAPEFGGNLDFVATCQDCHMRDVTGQGCNFGTPPVRDDLPLHDMTGGSTWLPGLLADLFPGEVDPAAMQAGITRARYMLQNAADLDVEQDGRTLSVTVTNRTGHKLPTGYPEGRRMWLGVVFRDATDAILVESGAYVSATGVLVADPQLKVYEAKPGLDDDTAGLVGVAPGPSFHFVLNNKIYKDNRIPPQGFLNANYAGFGGAPVGVSYADGQYWDTTAYVIPNHAVSVEVELLYQSTSKEYVEFLRDENQTNSAGDDLYTLWSTEGRCPPEEMVSMPIATTELAPGDADGDGDVDASDLARMAECLAGPGVPPLDGALTSFACGVIFDTDGDGDVDLADWAAVEAGTGTPSQPVTLAAVR